jgi:lipoprotein-anchoring transpeptidase ErfK/SrfK
MLEVQRVIMRSGISMSFGTMSSRRASPTAPRRFLLRPCLGSWSTASVVAGALAMTLAMALTMPLAAPASANILITIDKSAQQMSVDVDGAQRYVWPISTGRPGYDTPSGTYKPNRMDADHYSQEWDNAPMPHAIFFDLDGHAIHGFFDVKHLGMAVSHGCVRLSPDHATTLFDLVKTQGMGETKVVVAGRTPGGDNGPVARSHLPVNETAYGREQSPNYRQGGYAQPGYAQPGFAQPGYGQPTYAQPGFAQPGYGQPNYAQRSYAQPYGQPSYAQPSYGYAPPGYAPGYGPPGYR